MSKLLKIITSKDPKLRNQPLDKFCQKLSLKDLLAESMVLDRYWRDSDNLYERVRVLFFLYAIHRFHLPLKSDISVKGFIPFYGYSNLLKRRFEEAIDIFLNAQILEGPNDNISSALAVAYRELGFQTLANQVRQSVRSVKGNQWMFRIGHPDDNPLRIRPELITRRNQNNLFPILRERTPVRMDLTHSGWSDIFFLGMDFPQGARVLNVSIDLAVLNASKAIKPQPPVEAYFRVIDQPLLRLTSIDMKATVEITTLNEIFDFGRDYLGLLKAAVIASGIIPPGMEGAEQSLTRLLNRLVQPGYGLEIVSKVNDIPKGSRLAVSTSLLSCLITACMRATGQIKNLTGEITEEDRRVVAARAILGEWLGGSGGGWQDSGGIWPGMKMICGVLASEGDPEYGISQGCLLPCHTILSTKEVTRETRKKLQDSLILVHGGMAQDVGPILEMVTEKYLLRSEQEWQGRQEAIQIFDEITKYLKKGDIKAIANATHRNFNGPIQTIIPWTTNLYTETIINRIKTEFKKDFWGFWMLGGMSGGGMGFIFNPVKKQLALERVQKIMNETKYHLEKAIPFAMEPVVYDFTINEQGTLADLLSDDNALMPPDYYSILAPEMLRMQPQQLSSFRRAELDHFGTACRTQPELAGMVQELFDCILPCFTQNHSEEQTLESLLDQYGFDQVQHEQIKADMRNGRIGLSQNRLPVSSEIKDVEPEDVYDTTTRLSQSLSKLGLDAMSQGTIAVVTLAAGTGSRWTKGAGVVKAINPFCKLRGKHRTFIEVHLAKSRHRSRTCGREIPHIITTSYMTHEPIQIYLESQNYYNYKNSLFLSPGKSVGLRLIPMTRDLRFAWEEMPQQMLDEQAQKVRESIRTALINWTLQSGEGNDYTDNLPIQCLHPVGHWYEIPNMFRNGILVRLLDRYPDLKYLMIHNIDTLGADLDPAILGYHIDRGSAFTTEVITRRINDRGGGLSRVDGHLRLIEGLALPRDEIEFILSYYNSLTTWINIDKLLEIFSLKRDELTDSKKISTAIRNLAARMPTYITLKDVKKRWGKGQEDIFPVAQFEKLWGDMTGLSELNCHYVVVPRFRGQQLKEPAELDGWLWDGSAAYLDSICDWE